MDSSRRSARTLTLSTQCFNFATKPFSVEWKTALATRDRCAGDAAFANSASTGACQAPRSIEPGGISLLHSRADLAFRPSSNRSPLPDFCLPSNLGNSFDEPEPQD